MCFFFKLSKRSTAFGRLSGLKNKNKNASHPFVFFSLPFILSPHKKTLKKEREVNYPKIKRNRNKKSRKKEKLKLKKFKFRIKDILKRLESIIYILSIHHFFYFLF